MKPHRLLLILLLAGNVLSAAEAETAPFRAMRWEKLPDLNIPRAGHQMLLSGDEMVVVGGHTEGFIRTATAEYFSDGAWHTLKTLYPHDNGFSVRLPDGDFLIGGGNSEDFGVGQSYGVERYIPETRTFTAFPILDIKRTLSTAAVLADGRILVSGNWYTGDAIGISDGTGPFEIEQQVSQDRMCPYVFPDGRDGAVIFGGFSSTSEPQTAIVDCLDGPSYTPELFEQWRPHADFHSIRMDECKAVDPQTGREAYLFSADDPDGNQAILCFSEGTFSRIQTDHEIPVSGPWGPIEWGRYVQVDRARGVALMEGCDNAARAYLLCANYLPVFRGEAAPILVYYTDPLPEKLCGASVILPDGKFVKAGGHIPHDPMGNYNPSATVFAFSPFAEEETVTSAARPVWPFVLIALLALAAAALLLARRRSRRPEPDTRESDPGELKEEQKKESELFARVAALMETEELFRRKGLSVADIATQLGSNTKYISNCINTQARCSFNEYLNRYRIRYAQRLLREQPGVRLSEVSEAAGFTSESAFYRNFKTLTGQTPAEWLAEVQDNH